MDSTRAIIIKTMNTIPNRNNRFLQLTHSGYTTPVLLTSVVVLVLMAGYAYYLYQHRNDPANPNIVITSPENIPAASPPVSEAMPAEPVAVPETAPASVVEEDGEVIEPDQEIASLDPNAPCAVGLTACVRSSADTTVDPDCPAYKPIWAYFSNDKGMSWKRAGCYATEIDANKGLSNARLAATALAKKQAEQALAAKTPPEPTPAPLPAAAAPAAPKPTVEAALPPSAGKTGEIYQVKFKGAFGMTVETRTYHSAEMKQKALELWDRERKLLEPDGSINTKHVQPQTSGVIPGH